jgi:hypothetical protein
VPIIVKRAITPQLTSRLYIVLKKLISRIGKIAVPGKYEDDVKCDIIKE